MHNMPDYQYYQDVFCGSLIPQEKFRNRMARAVDYLSALERRYTVVSYGQDSRKMTARESARQVAYIPQSSNPSFNYSVSDIVLMGSTASLSRFASPGKKDFERCEWALEKIGISELSERCFHRLSGGERQLVMLARALTQNAPILMLDEPTANLDFGNQLRVLQMVRELSREGYTVLLSTHDPQQALRFSDRVLALYEGRVLAEGDTESVLTQTLLRRLYRVETEFYETPGGTVILPEVTP